ncbi:sensor histidine kinase [Anaeromyxobacter sp. PSR-1]|uniref:sensor histidine kinase n=1 Tax=Anaeromyxobacter sp. PSR-1 TaxID=1300915 RepID=UPI0005DF5F4B|nr:sensor histidine kinase [Anaeromyxobacter sp. PSR-1]GAO05334.1 sensor protein ZraS [Anaeromyxobacter sp. PSR-1]
MTRAKVAARLSVMLALTGVAPIVALGAVGIEAMRRHAEASTVATMQELARQAAERIDAYLAAQEEALRVGAAASVADAHSGQRLEELVLEAPGLGRVVRVGPETPPSALPERITPALAARARAGTPVRSAFYLARDLTPAQDLCVPAPSQPYVAVCASLDLLELWRFVGRVHGGGAGTVLAFDESGRLVASGAGALRAAVLTGERVPEAEVAVRVARGEGTAPTHWVGLDGEELLGGWARLPRSGWAVAVARPAGDAARAARTAQWALAAVVLAALALSLAVGLAQSKRVLAELEREERWRTAGRIAAGVTHDLGHRVAILQQLARLAEEGRAEALPRLRDGLRAEVAALRAFVADFSDLSRDVRAAERIPLELGAFAASLVRTAGPHAGREGVTLGLEAGAQAWIRADRHLLERAALNLVWNACEASPAGAEVRLRAAVEGGRGLLSVTDRGAGMPPERLASLFDLGSTKRGAGHLGLGLANVRRIVEGLGGAVEVASAEGAGTTFTLSFPAIAPPPPLEEEA